LHVQFHLGPVEEKRRSRRSRTAVACIVIASLPGVLHSRGVIRTNSGRLHQPLCVSLPLNMVQIILIPTYQRLITQYSLFNFIYVAIFVPTHIFHLGRFFSFSFQVVNHGLGNVLSRFLFTPAAKPYRYLEYVSAFSEFPGAFWRQPRVGPRLMEPYR
jgi:hypothetical protein